MGSKSQVGIKLDFKNLISNWSKKALLTLRQAVLGSSPMCYIAPLVAQN